MSWHQFTKNVFSELNHVLKLDHEAFGCYIINIYKRRMLEEENKMDQKEGEADLSVSRLVQDFIYDRLITKKRLYSVSEAEEEKPLPELTPDIQNRHPDLPKWPLTSYELFYMEWKDKVAKEHPYLEMTGVSKLIAEVYEELSDKRKQKYTDMGAAQCKDYDEKMVTFYLEHPDVIPSCTQPHGSLQDDGQTLYEMGDDSECPSSPPIPKLGYEPSRKKCLVDPDHESDAAVGICGPSSESRGSSSEAGSDSDSASGDSDSENSGKSSSDASDTTEQPDVLQ